MKPILFNTAMVNALLEGRKTVTRRIANINAEITCNDGTTNHEFVPDNFNPTLDNPTGFVCRKCGFGVAAPHSRVPCGTSLFQPRYWPGDILYVRETWQKVRVRKPQRAVPADFSEIQYFYRADGEIANSDDTPFLWRPSIHMPKEAARIFLKVKSVRVERLQSITIEEALKEGCTGLPCDCANRDEHGCVDCFNTGWIEPPQLDFMELWNSTIKPADLPTCGWEANPWCWVIEFERCEKPKEVGT